MSKSKSEIRAATVSSTVVDASDHTHGDPSELRQEDDVLLAQLGYKAEFRREFSVSTPEVMFFGRRHRLHKRTYAVM